MAYLSYKLATIKTDCQLDVNFENLSYDFPFSAQVQKLFQRLCLRFTVKTQRSFWRRLYCRRQNARAFGQYGKRSTLSLLRSKTNWPYNLEKMEFSTNTGKIYYLSPTFDIFMANISLGDLILKIEADF